MSFGYKIISTNKYESQLSTRAMESCEEMMTEIGAEIHDDLIQKIAILQYDLQQIKRSQHEAKELHDMILKMEANFTIVINSVRRISRRLMPVSNEDDTFTSQLSILCQNMEHPGANHIHFEPSGNETRLEKTISKHLYRIVQELIHNAFKHSSAWHIWVRLQWKKDQLVIEVEDDGTAFAKMQDVIRQLKKKNNSLRMRADSINARIVYSEGLKGLLARITYAFPEIKS
jgi:signal transduction histidine kinase